MSDEHNDERVKRIKSLNKMIDNIEAKLKLYQSGIIPTNDLKYVSIDKEAFIRHRMKLLKELQISRFKTVTALLAELNYAEINKATNHSSTLPSSQSLPPTEL